MFTVSSCLKFLSSRKICVATELGIQSKSYILGLNHVQGEKDGWEPVLSSQNLQNSKFRRYANHQNRTQLWQMIQGRGNVKEWWKLTIRLGNHRRLYTDMGRPSWALQQATISIGGHCEAFSHKGSKAARWESTASEKSYQVPQGDGSKDLVTRGRGDIWRAWQNPVPDPGLRESRRCALRGSG